MSNFNIDQIPNKIQRDQSVIELSILLQKLIIEESAIEVENFSSRQLSVFEVIAFDYPAKDLIQHIIDKIYSARDKVKNKDKGDVF